MKAVAQYTIRLLSSRLKLNALEPVGGLVEWKMSGAVYCPCLRTEVPTGCRPRTGAWVAMP
jgi:hypothetical protein